jgi:hypothetical protein
MWDKMINAEIILQQGDKLQRGKVKRRSIDDNGKTIGTYSDNPIMNSIVYEVESPDGESKEYAANILAENMLSQVDHDGHSKMLMRDIIDYERDEAMAVPIEDKYLTTRSGQRRMKEATQRWRFLANWKDGTESWVKLAELKDSYPFELAEFAKALGKADEPAFAWWVPHALRRRNAILSAVKARVRKKTQKFPQVWSGPMSWTESMAILCGCMLSSWRCTMLELPLRCLRMAKVHHKDGRRQVMYTDDALSIGVEAESILRKEIGHYFELKEKSIGPPKLYLGGHLSLAELDNGVKAWAFSSSRYVRAAVQNVEDFIAKDETKRWKLPSKAETPLCTSYRPELDVTPR